MERDLLGRRVEITNLWELGEPLRLVRKQQQNGSWRPSEIVSQMTKGFAPSPPDKAARAWAGSLVIIVLLSAVSYQVWRMVRKAEA